MLQAIRSLFAAALPVLLHAAVLGLTSRLVLRLETGAVDEGSSVAAVQREACSSDPPASSELLVPVHA